MHVPTALAALPQWIVWRYEQKPTDKDPRKVPYDPRSGRKAKSNDPQTWATLAEAQAVADQYAGLGFMFKAGGGICGVDFDGCIADGRVADWALEDLQRLPTYAEVSPSGSGIKAFLLAELPGGKGRKHSMPGDHCGIEVYGAGRYFAFTGQRFSLEEELADCQAGLNELVNKYWPDQPAAPAPAPIQYATSTTVGGGCSVEERAARYLDRLPPAVSGQSGHNATFRAACVLVLGFALPVERAFPLLAAWNQNCQPPWSDGELWHKLGDADKRTGERGWLLRGERYGGPDVDISALLASVPPESTEDAPKYEPAEALAMPAELLQCGGLIQEIVDLSMSSFRYRQPELSLAAALALMATITGRKVQDEGGARTNLYILGIAASGAGKEGGREVNKSILCESGAQNMMGPESVNSSAGLVVAIRDNPAILLQIDEIGRLLATTNGARAPAHLSNIITELLRMYSSSRGWWRPSAYADAKKNPLIYCPHGVVYGTATPDTFWPSMTVEALGEGFLGRCLIFESRTRYPMPQPYRRFEKAPESIVEQVKAWLAFTPGGGNLASQNPTAAVIEADDAATRRLRTHEWQIREKQQTEDSRHSAVWSRAAEKTFKLALLFACSRGTRELAAGKLPTITKRDADLAVMTCNWTTRSLIRRAADYIAHNEIEASVKRLLRAIPGEGCTLSELTRRTQWMRSKERQDVLTTLSDAGIIAFEQLQTNGRPITVVKRTSTPF